MAEDVVDHAEESASLKKRRCETENLQLHGWTRASIPENHLQVYGSDAAAIRDLIREEPELETLLHPELEFSLGEVVWQVRHEMARTVEDVLARRTRALLLNARAAMEAASLVATTLARELGRDETWADTQVKTFRALAQGYIYA